MSTYNIQFHDKIRKTSLNICFLQLLEEFCRDWKKEFQSPTVNEPSLFKQLRLYCIFITKTWLYNFDPLEPHFYIVKLGFTGVYIIFRISAQNVDCGYSLEPPCRGSSNEYPQSMFWTEIWKISEFLPENFFGGEILQTLYKMVHYQTVLDIRQFTLWKHAYII